MDAEPCVSSRGRDDRKAPSLGATCARAWPRAASGRIEALLRNRAFVAAYKAARQAWQNAAEATFPLGTYWLRRFANVPIAQA
jgi:hypothetical protein